jgi:hypothetical protein
VLLLAKEWLPDALLTKPAAVYLATVLEYMTAEILELGGNACRDNRSTVIIPRSLLLAIEYDEELEAVFRKVIFRDSAVRPPNAHRIFSIPLTQGPLTQGADKRLDNEGHDYGDDDYDEYAEPRCYDHVFRQNFNGHGSHCGDDPFCAADARNGYLYMSVERDIYTSTAASVASVLTRRQRQVAAVERLFGRNRDLLAAEFPISCARTDIMKLSPRKLRSTMLQGITTEARVELCCIDRSAVKELLQVYAPSCSFTHEAVNILLLALQHHLRVVMVVAAFSTPTLQRGMIEAADATAARNMLGVMQAARVGDLNALENIVVQQQFDVNMLCKNETALTVACDCGQLTVIAWLVAHGATVDLSLKPGTMASTMTAILAAAMKRTINVDVVRLLLDLGANINSRGGDMSGSTLLMYLCKSGDSHVEFIRELISRGVNINDSAVGNRRNALHAACESKQWATAEALIFGGIDATVTVTGTTAIENVRDTEGKERLRLALQQMEEPGFK